MSNIPENHTNEFNKFRDSRKQDFGSICLICDAPGWQFEKGLRYELREGFLYKETELITHDYFLFIDENRDVLPEKLNVKSFTSISGLNERCKPAHFTIMNDSSYFDCKKDADRDSIISKLQMPYSEIIDRVNWVINTIPSLIEEYSISSKDLNLSRLNYINCFKTVCHSLQTVDFIVTRNNKFIVIGTFDEFEQIPYPHNYAKICRVEVPNYLFDLPLAGVKNYMRVEYQNKFKSSLKEEVSYQLNQIELINSKIDIVRSHAANIGMDLSSEEAFQLYAPKKKINIAIN